MRSSSAAALIGKQPTINDVIHTLAADNQRVPGGFAYSPIARPPLISSDVGSSGS
jgi:hypothetical protein